MGEVYRARDTDLDRPVAIKILPAALAANVQRLQRFTQEAKAASALNHPHIITIHEIGAQDDIRFMATEFVDGDTLRVRIAEGIKFGDLLEIATQVASALAAAHDAGIVHRDIKPENIMVRRDGFVKVLDFGLAKLMESKSSATDAEAPTRAMVNTDAGTVMGTANYMSPEQAKGTSVDSRTDLWSLGVVLYEMIAGQLPFVGETPTETISLILQREPAPLSRFVDEVPSELERIVSKALTKDRDGRYQTARDLLIDLRNLKRRLEVDAEIDRSVPTEMRVALSTKSAQKVGVTNSAAARSKAELAPASAGETIGAHPSSAEFLFDKIRKHRIAAGAVAALLVAIVLGGYLFFRSRNEGAAIDSIAVLPFENPDAANEYLSDGVTESIINNLAQFPNLRVSPRSTVFYYKGQKKDPLVVGAELGVRALLTGRMSQREGNLIISVELVDVKEKKQIWGEQYNRRLVDALGLQQEISREISERLRLKLPGQNQTLSVKSSTRNPEAYQLYLKGRYYFTKYSEEDVENAIQYFNEAINRDPNYAQAYSGLADSYFWLADVKYAPRDSMPKMKVAAQRALQIDEYLAEAHVSLAIALYQYDFDWPAAEREMKRAIQLDPNYPFAHHQYGWFLAYSGRLQEAGSELARAAQLDPLNLAMVVDENVPLVLSKQYDRALGFPRKGEEMDPKFFLSHYVEGWIYGKKGDYRTAVAKYQKARELENQPWIYCWVGNAYAGSGDRQNAQKIIDELTEESKRRYVSPYFFAVVYAGLKDKEKTIEYLKKAYDDRSVWIVWIGVEDIFDFVRADPRFQEIARGAGVPQR
jgi:serine/threonine-protein kinase